MSLIKKLFSRCNHVWATMLYSYGYYDQEIWEECVKCKKQIDIE